MRLYGFGDGNRVLVYTLNMEFDRLGGLRGFLEWRIEGRRPLCELLNSAQIMILSPLYVA